MTTEVKVEEQPAASAVEDDESSHRLKRSQLEAVGTLLAVLLDMTSLVSFLLGMFDSALLKKPSSVKERLKVFAWSDHDSVCWIIVDLNHDRH